MRPILLCLLLSSLFQFSCINSNDQGRASDQKNRDSISVAPDSTMTKNNSKTKSLTMGNEAALQQALWAQYDAIKEIRNSIPDSIQTCKSPRERYFFNQADGNLDHIQSDIRNRTDSILLKQLKLHVNELSDVIIANEMNMKRLERFTQTLKKVTFGINQVFNIAGSMIGIGILKALPARPIADPAKAGMGSGKHL